MRNVFGIVTVAGLLLAGASVWAQDDPSSPPPGAPLGAPAVASDDETAKLLETCYPCHGDGGVSRIPTRPTIAGQKSGYVARQLFAFKRSATQDAAAPVVPHTQAGRFDPIMSHMAVALDDAAIPKIAQAVSQLPCDGGKAAAANPPAMPEVAVLCASCHGENGISRMPEVPNVAGQQRAYLRRQLLLIRETAWGAVPRENETWRIHPIMERQSARLSIEDVDALAKYYAALDCRAPQQP